MGWSKDPGPPTQRGSAPLFSFLKFSAYNKNGNGAMVVIGMEDYLKLTESIEEALDVADVLAEETSERYTHEEMFSKLREAEE